MSKSPAALDNFMKFRIVNNINIHRIEMSINPARGDLSPKNAADQRTFRINWTANKKRAFFTS
jgi:hypothetical protein